jgi:hypothetical protein
MIAVVEAVVETGSVHPHAAFLATSAAGVDLDRDAVLILTTRAPALAAGRAFLFADVPPPIPPAIRE